jgi:hypothetical protein
MRTLPHEHSTQPSITPVQTPEVIHEYWSTFVAKWGSRYEECLERAVALALSFGLRPRLTRTVLRACGEHRSLRFHRTIPLPLLFFLCNYLFYVMPIAWDRNIFRLFSFLFRASLLSRLRGTVMRLFGRTDGRRSWYDEYRQVQDD